MDARINIVNKERLNAGEARNIGMRAASGEFLMFLDADDFFEPELLHELLLSCLIYNADICLCAGSNYNDATGGFEGAPWLLREDLLPAKNPFSRKDCYERLFQIVSACAWTKMFRRSFIEKNGLRFQSMRTSNDMYFAHSALAMAKRITSNTKKLINYRINVPNSLQLSKSQSPLDFYKALTALQTRLKDSGIYSELEQSFADLAFSNIMFNIRKQTTSEAADEIIDVFLREYITQYDIEGKAAECFTPEYYTQYEELLQTMKKESGWSES